MKGSEAREVAFFGRITASFTHEVKNILAIIKESSGLMEDLLALTREQPFPYWERFAHRVSVIQQQVQRGVGLATRLNRFAHSTDEPITRIDLNEIADQLIWLAERLARLKEVTLKVSLAEHAVPLDTSPINLQMAVFTLMEGCWNQLPAQSAVELRVAKSDGFPCLIIACSGEGVAFVDLKRGAEASGALQLTSDGVAGLHGKIVDQPDACGFALVFVGP